MPFKRILKILLVIWISIIFVFALLSGSEEYGGGLEGILKNSPNALPWVVVLGVLYLTRKRDLEGGVLLVLLGIGAILIGMYESLVIILCIPLPLISVGVFLLISWYTDRNKQN